MLGFIVGVGRAWRCARPLVLPVPPLFPRSPWDTLLGDADKVIDQGPPTPARPASRTAKDMVVTSLKRRVPGPAGERTAGVSRETATIRLLSSSPVRLPGV